MEKQRCSICETAHGLLKVLKGYSDASGALPLLGNGVFTVATASKLCLLTVHTTTMQKMTVMGLQQFSIF